MANDTWICPEGGEHELEHKGTDTDGGGILECKKCMGRIKLILGFDKGR